MAQMEPGAHSSIGTKRKLHAPRIDMTPMVDLGFLLITFFIFTTTMSQPSVTGLIMPADGPASVTAESKALTILLGADDKVFAYEGRWEDAQTDASIIRTGYHSTDGVGKLIRNKQAALLNAGGKEAQDDLVLIIKPTPDCTYKNFIDALDETTINDVKKYVVDGPTSAEKEFVKK